MKRIYKFIAGNSRVTPIGIAIAIVLGAAFRGTQSQLAQGLYIGVLLATLAASTFEPVQ
jgi:predicted cobalt transporter CbtA